MPPRPRRERCLITREGYVLVQDDPYEHAVPVVLVEIGDRVCRFLYEHTVTVAADVTGAERALTMSTYLEEEEAATSNGEPP